MRLLSSLVTTLLVISGYTNEAQASSIRRNPIQTANRLHDVHFSTAWQQVQSTSRFDATFKIKFGEVVKRVRLALEPNNDIISHETDVHTIGADGRSEASKIVRSEHRVFKGTAFVARDTKAPDWRDAGWARIVVHSDGRTPLFEGAFSIDGDYHHVQTGANYERTRLDQDPALDGSEEPFLVVWRDSDVRIEEDRDAELRKRDEKKPNGCGVDIDNHLSVIAGTGGNTSDFVVHGLPELKSSSGVLNKRQSDNGISTIGSTAGCPPTRRVALMGIATDCNYVKQFPSPAEAKSNIILQVNTASALFEKSFNVSLAIRTLNISEVCVTSGLTAENRWNQDCSVNMDISARLSSFSAFRGRIADNNAFWTLMSSCTSNQAVGIAWLGALCMRNSQTDSSSGATVAGANYVAKTPNEWQVLAHEIGHTFGAEHDCFSSTCASASASGAQGCCPLSSTTCDAQQRFIMNPSARGGITNFSQCSIGAVCSKLSFQATSSRGLGRCLVDNANIGSIEPQCGNGLVETGEDCDSDNACCDQKTCKFSSGATCDPASSACCTAQCAVAQAGGVCRPSLASCDPEETCNGSSPQCPTDVSSIDDNGRCSSNSVGDFFSQNRTLVIGLIAGIGGLIVICVISCCISSLRRRSAVRKQHRQMVAAQAAGARGGYGQPSHTHRPPPPPPPGYYGGQQPPMSGPWPQPPPRTLSARYA